jgi:hypothetical protein
MSNKKLLVASISMLANAFESVVNVIFDPFNKSKIFCGIDRIGVENN